MLKKILLAFFGLSLIQGTAWAASKLDADPMNFESTKLISEKPQLLPTKNRFYGQASGGVGFSKIGENQVLTFFEDGTQNAYGTDNETSTGGFGSLAVGYSLLLNKPLELRVGLEGAYLDYGTLNGSVQQNIDIDPNPTITPYSFEGRSILFFQQTQLVWLHQNGWNPFALVGLGVSWNKLSNYQEQGVNSTVNTFRSGTTTDFAYEIGAGIEKRLSSTLALSISYRYLHAGSGKLDTFSGQTTNDQFKSGNLNTNLIVLSVLF